MRQLTCTAPHQIEWRDVPEPHLEGDTEALVRPLAVARCDIDLFLTSGFVPLRGPFALGHEAVAEVVDVGDSVPGLTKGQRTVVSFEVSCGSCRSCRAGHTANCDRYPVLSDYGMQPLSGVEYGGMLSDIVRVSHLRAYSMPSEPRSRRAFCRVCPSTLAKCRCRSAGFTHSGSASSSDGHMLLRCFPRSCP